MFYYSFFMFDMSYLYLKYSLKKINREKGTTFKTNRT